LVLCRSFILFDMFVLTLLFFLCQTLLRLIGIDAYHPIYRMTRSSSIGIPWFPQSKQDYDDCMRELREILASPQFCNSKRYPALLQYIVENTLAGKAELLKERTLGVEVFDRPATYDTNADTVVRYTAGEVRKRLSLYYHERGHVSRISISLPAGSYIPEFIQAPLASEQLEVGPSASLASSAVQPPIFDGGIPAAPRQATAIRKALPWVAGTGTLLLVLLIGFNLRAGKAPNLNAVDDFWSPVLHEQQTVPICTGSVVFAQHNFSGVMTADKNIDYPFVSLQSASAIAQLGGLIQEAGAKTVLLSAPSTPLTELREHSVILLGGYNNQWTMRLLQPLRFHMTMEPTESIVDKMRPEVHWSRDRSLSYSSADDYALVARYRDTDTDSWVVALAGLGRNGTEAATQFAVSPRYMQLLRDQMGGKFSNRNIEAVLKVSVIDGKTGAPSILAVHSW